MYLYKLGTNTKLTEKSNPYVVVLSYALLEEPALLLSRDHRQVSTHRSARVIGAVPCRLVWLQGV